MINEIIKNLRKEKDLTQEQLAKKIGYPRYVISDWEQGRSQPNVEQIKIICVFFNITADELLEIDTPGERSKVNINNSFNNSKNIKVKIK